MIPKTYAQWFQVFSDVNRSLPDGPFDTSTLRKAALAGVDGGIDVACRVIEDEAKNPMRGLAEGAWPL